MSKRRQIILHGAVWFAVSQILPLVSTAALSVVLAKFRGADELGVQSLIAYNEALLWNVLVWSLTSGTVQKLSALSGRGDRATAGAFARWSFHVHLVLGAALCAVLLVVGQLRADYASAWALAGLSAATTSVAWAYGCQVAAARGWAPVGRAHTVTQLLSTGFGLATILAGGGIAWVFLGNVLGSLLLALRLRKFVDRTSSRPRLRPPSPFSRLWIMLVASQLVTQVVVSRIEFFVLDFYSTDSEIAMYSIAFMLASAAGMVPSSIALSSMPVMAAEHSGGSSSRVALHFARAVRVSMLLSLALGAALIALGPGLIRLLYGAEFERAADLLLISAIGLLAMPVASLCMEYWLSLGRMRGVLIIGASAGVAGLAIAFALVPTHGALGAVVANLIAQVVLAAALGWRTWREAGRFDWRWLGWGTMLFVAALAGGLGALTAEMIGGVPGVIVAGLLTVTLLISGVAVGRILKADDAGWLAEVLPAQLGRFVVALGRLSAGGRR